MDTFDADLMGWMEQHGDPDGFQQAELKKARRLLTGDDEERMCAKALLARLSADFKNAGARALLESEAG